MKYLGHEYVEIAGIKWATTNVGALNVTDAGLYFQWGDTQGYTSAEVGNSSGKKAFTWEDYKYGNSTMTKYNSTDEKTTIEEFDDAVQANWGGLWRMPTASEFQALGAAVNAIWTSNYDESGVAGLVCTDKNDSSKVLFFPAVGQSANGNVINTGTNGYYWSSSRNISTVKNAYHLSLKSDGVNWENDNTRRMGYSIRGVFTGTLNEYLDYDGLQTYHNNMNIELGKKANSSDVYTKIVANNKFATIENLENSEQVISAALNDLSSRIDDLDTATEDHDFALDNKVDKTTTVNGHALDSNVTVTKSDVGLGNVDNTSDVDKPISKATQTALDDKVDKTITINGHALSSNVTVTKSDVGLGNVGNFKAVSTVASQGLSSTEKSNARTNIGAAKSSHTHGNIGNDGTLTDTATASEGDDYIVIRDADDSKIQTSTIKGVDVADAVSKKHSHSSITLSTTAQKYDGTNTIALPSSDPYSSARTPSSHSHGNITNSGTITSTAVTSATGVLVYDSSNKIQRATASSTRSIINAAINTSLGNSDNLNDIKTPGFYNAGGGNSITNKPSGVEHFGLEVIHYASGNYYVQIVYNNSGSWRRRCDNGTWGNWVQDELTDTKYSNATQSASGLMSASDKTKLDGVTTGSTKVEASTTNGNIKINGTETIVYTHPSGTNPHGTTKSDVDLGNVTNDSQVKRSEMGVANGVATLGSDGKVPSSQLPSYVDDVIDLLNVTGTAPTTCAIGDKYYNTSSNKIFTATAANTWESTGETPEAGKIYVNLANMKTYRWSGTTLAVISETLALGETSSTAYRGDRGKIAYDHSQSTHARTDATNTNVSYDTTDKKITKTVNGTTSDVVTASTIVTDGGGIKSHATHKLITTNDTASTVSQGTEITYVESVAGNTTATSGNLTLTATRKKITVPAIPDNASQSTAGLMSAEDKTKLDGISIGANAYVHPTGDGNSHVPATGTTNNGKVLMAGSTANSASWQSLGTASTKNIPTSGNAATTEVVMGNDSRLSDSRTPKSHTHGNIQNGGTLNDTAAAPAGNDYIVIRDADNSKIQTSNIKGVDVEDAVNKKHEHVDITLSTTTQAYDGTHTIALPASDPYTSTRTPKSHTHGNIQNGGTLQTNDITIANGDKLVVTDSSDSSKVARTSISFDGSTTTKALTQKGTFETFLQSQDISGKQDKVAKLGSTTKPVYTSAAGTFDECSTYAGGTALTLNGVSKAASTASLYAPTSAGTAGQILLSSGGTPNWKTGDIIHYVTSPSGTAGSTASGSYNRTQWTGTVDGVTALYTGLTILYKIPVAGVNKGVTLEINSLGEHPVVVNTNTNISTRYGVGCIIPLVYDEDQKANVYVSNNNTEYTGCWKMDSFADGNTIPQPQCETAAGTQAKGATCSNFSLANKSYIMVNMRYANSYNGKITLNINSTGAKDIYINGSVSSSSNKTLPAGSYLVYYADSKYYFRTDGKITGNITGDAATVNGKTVEINVPSTAVFTDTKVTSVGNHYTPSADVNSELTASLSGTAGSYALNSEYTVLTGVKAQRDAKGHVTGLTYTAQKVKDTNTTYTFDGTYNASTNKAATVSTVTGSYVANLHPATSANYITEPEFKSVKINGSSTNSASSKNCVLQYDTTNECVKFIFN